MHNYTPETLVSQIREMAEKANWMLYENLHHSISKFSETRDINGLNTFFEEVLSLSKISKNLHKKLVDYDYSGFERKLALAFREASNPKNIKDNVKAIYYEYSFYNADFFHCYRYEKSSDSDWPAYFEDMVTSPQLEIFLEAGDWDTTNFESAIIREFLNAKIAVALIKALDDYSALPVAMAEHDMKVIYFQSV